MRKLASIQIISNIEDIEGADTIKRASVLGWKTVIKDGNFSIGDKCVFVEIDSVFPDKPEFADFLKRGNRLKTIRLLGNISQGVCLPLSLLPAGDYNVGDDVTEVLGITKYEPAIPAQLAGDVKGVFPSYICKTDEERIQTCSWLLSKYKDATWEAREKLDGCSCTMFIKDGEFGVCSRNLELKESENNTLWKLARRYSIEKILRNDGRNLAIQGEIIGEGIQGNKYKLKGQDFYAFNLFDIDNYRYFSSDELSEFCDNNKINIVPYLFNLFDIQAAANGCSIDFLIYMTKGVSKLRDTQREGIVCRPKNEIIDPKFGRVSFKVINPEFLLKHGE